MNVLLYESGCYQRVNAGFQNPQRPAWYRATQEIIVPREPLFEALCGRLLDHCLDQFEELVIFEPGVGVGSFFEYVLTQSALPELFSLHLIGADLSQDMVRTGFELISGLKPRPGWKPVRVELYSRVNLLELNSPDVKLVVRHKPFHALVALQFEHYYPNHPDSPLAQKLQAGGPAAPTKHEFRRFARNQLHPNGLYFTLDDYTSGVPAEDDCQLEAWDAYVADQLSDPECLRRLAQEFPRVATVLARKYDRGQGPEVLRQKVASARQRRRTLCNEESSDLQSALVDLHAIFGHPVELQQHPWRRSHSLFYLLAAKLKAPEVLNSRLDSQAGSWHAIPENHGTVASP